MDYAIVELKNQAAKLGADGLFLGAAGEKTTTVMGGYGTGFVYAVPVMRRQFKEEPSSFRGNRQWHLRSGLTRTLAIYPCPPPGTCTETHEFEDRHQE